MGETLVASFALPVKDSTSLEGLVLPGKLRRKKSYSLIPSLDQLSWWNELQLFLDNYFQNTQRKQCV